MAACSCLKCVNTKSWNRFKVKLQGSKLSRITEKDNFPAIPASPEHETLKFEFKQLTIFILTGAYLQLQFKNVFFRIV